MVSEKDKLLIKHLRGNSRKGLAQISKETKTPISTLFHGLKRLESGVILKHTSLIDFSKIGYNVKVHFILGSRQKPRLKNFLRKNKNVNTLSTLINESDFYAECIFQDLKEMIEFKESLKEFDITDLQESFIIEEVKKEEFNP